MNTASWEQIKSMFQSMSKVLFGNIASVKKKADSAQKTADAALSGLDGKLTAENPEVIGSFTLGYRNSAVNGENSVAIGRNIKAEGLSSLAHGVWVYAIADYSHAEGRNCEARGTSSHAEGDGSVAYGSNSHAEGYQTIANGSYSHAEGTNTDARGAYSHAEGAYTIAVGNAQHVQGIANIADDYPGYDKKAKHAHIVGNGTPANPSNAYTLDWDGNGWYAGTVECTGLILKSSTEGSEKRFLITVDDSGAISAAELTEA